MIQGGSQHLMLSILLERGDFGPAFRLNIRKVKIQQYYALIFNITPMGVKNINSSFVRD
jgi:hypothetical protein